MNQEIYFVVFNAALYLLALILNIKYNKHSTISLLILSIWALSSATSILYFSTLYSAIIQTNKITLIPFCYLFASVTIFFLPIYQFKNNLVYRIYGNRALLLFLSWSIAIISVLPFLESVIYTVNTLGNNQSQFAENYEERVTHLTPLGLILYRYTNYLRIITPVLLFYFLSDKKINKPIIVGLLIATITPILGSLNGGSRFILVTDALYLFFIYLIFAKQIDSKIRKKISKYAALSGIFLVSIFVLITIFRFQSKDRDFNMMEWLSLYSGESFLNFNADLWNIKTTTHGDNSFFVFKYLIGDYETPLRDYEHLETYVPIRMNVFYTFVGDFYVDLGRQTTFIFICVIAFLFYKLCRWGPKLSIEKIMILGMYGKICISGFTYYTYLNTALGLIYTILIIAFIRGFSIIFNRS